MLSHIFLLFVESLSTLSQYIERYSLLIVTTLLRYTFCIYCSNSCCGSSTSFYTADYELYSIFLTLQFSRVCLTCLVFYISRVISTFLECSRMTVVFYYSVMHGLGFFICFMIQILRVQNNKTRFFYVLYSDKTYVFDQSERSQGPIYVIKRNNFFSNCGHGISTLVRSPSLGTFRSEDEDDYEYEFSVLSMRIRFGGRHFLKCACSEQKTCTRSRPRPPI